MKKVIISSRGKINNKKLELENKDFFTSQINRLEEGKELYIEIGEYNKKEIEEKQRTIQQNKYYHKLLEIISEFTGYSHREIHLELKVTFLSNPYVMGNKEYTLVGSTTNLNSKNFGEYLERVFEWASNNHGITLPDSSDYY